MTKNPLINALLAVLYIALVASVMFYGTKNHPGPDNSVLIPIAVLSLFTLSAAVMGYLFLSQPLQLYLGGKKQHGIDLFLQTIAIFGAITAFLLLLLFSRVLG